MKSRQNTESQQDRYAELKISHVRKLDKPHHKPAICRVVNKVIVNTDTVLLSSTKGETYAPVTFDFSGLLFRRMIYSSSLTHGGSGRAGMSVVSIPGSYMNKNKLFVSTLGLVGLKA
jgi:hypothetical protein